MYRNRYTNESPIVLHATGSLSRSTMWQEARDQVFAAPLVAVADLQGVRYAVITWNTKQTSSILENSLQRFDYFPHVLGRGDGQWTNPKKTGYTLDLVDGLDVDYVIGLDAFDIMVLQHPDEIVRRFLERFPGLSLLFNAAPRPWPGGHPSMVDVDRYDYDTPGHCRHLNAGAWIGTRAAVLEFFEAVDDLHTSHDWGELENYEQPKVRLAALAGMKAGTIGIDRRSVIFHHMAAAKDIVWEVA